MAADEREESRYRDKIEAAILRHTQYFDHLPWPKVDSPAWMDLVKTWVDAFGERRTAPAKVEKACRTIRENPPEFKTEHLPELLRLINERDENYAQPGDAGQGEVEGHACPHCEGAGIVRIYRSDYAGRDHEWVAAEDGGRRLVVKANMAPCVCQRGRGILGNWQASKIQAIDLGRGMPRGWSMVDPTSEAAAPATARIGGAA